MSKRRSVVSDEDYQSSEEEEDDEDGMREGHSSAVETFSSFSLSYIISVFIDLPNIH